MKHLIIPTLATTLLLNFGCVMPLEPVKTGENDSKPIESSPLHSRLGTPNGLRGKDVPAAARGIEKKDAAYELHKGKDFEFETPAQDRAADGREAFHWSDADPTYILMDKTYVVFNDSATQSDVDNFLSDFNAKVTHQYIPGVKTYLVEFDLSKVELDVAQLKKGAKSEGFYGKHTFSSKRAAKYLQIFCAARFAKSKYNISGIGLQTEASVSNEDIYSEGLMPDGYRLATPTSQYWFHQVMTGTSTWFGNNINPAQSLYSSVFYYTKGGGVRVAVIDAAFYRTDEGLNSPQVTGYRTPVLYNAANGSSGSVPASNYPENLHGRRIASVLFSKENDNYGVMGIAPDAQPILIHAPATYDSSGLSIKIAAITWAANQSTSGGQAKIINNSWSVPQSLVGSNPTAHALYTAIVTADNNNVIQVAASGNDPSGGARYPASYDKVISVCGHDSSGYPSIAGYGWVNETNAEIWAAGSWVPVANDSTSSPNVKADFNHGTSYATALVSGALALYVAEGKVSNTANSRSKLVWDAWWRTVNGKTRMYLDVLYGLEY